jgi:hypothetical protein
VFSSDLSFSTYFYFYLFLISIHITEAIIHGKYTSVEHDTKSGRHRDVTLDTTIENQKNISPFKVVFSNFDIKLDIRIKKDTRQSAIITLMTVFVECVFLLPHRTFHFITD